MPQPGRTSLRNKLVGGYISMRTRGMQPIAPAPRDFNLDARNLLEKEHRRRTGWILLKRAEFQKTDEQEIEGKKPRPPAEQNHHAGSRSACGGPSSHLNGAPPVPLLPKF
jgi:hypothetical protein